jgi:hypothetical protein
MAFQGYHSSRFRARKSSERAIAIPLVNQSNVVLKLCRIARGRQELAQRRKKKCRPYFRAALSIAGGCWVRQEIYFCASIFSITIAVDPPRANVFPLAVTFWPANGSSLSFWPLDGVVSAMGQ